MSKDRRTKRPAERPPHRRPADRPNPPKRELPDSTQPAEERGERIETGKAIHRAGKEHGHVPGATEQK
jgi:hypothetical protein